MASESILDYALHLHRVGMIPIPLCDNSKHISFRAMGLPPYHTITARKRLKDIAYQSLCFHLALRPPGQVELGQWFAGHRGGIGIVGGYRGLVVLDFDYVTTFDRWARIYPSLAGRTAVEKTPAGYHVYLKCETPLPCTSLYFNAQKAGHLTGLGGYVACSRTTGQCGSRYEWLPHQSPLDVELAVIPDIRSISMYPTGWVRRHANRLLGRGSFEPAEQMSREEFLDVSSYTDGQRDKKDLVPPARQPGQT